MKKKKILIITSKAFNPSWKVELKKTYKKAKILFIEDIKGEILKHVANCNAMIGCPRYVFKKQDFDFFKHLDSCWRGWYRRFCWDQPQKI